MTPQRVDTEWFQALLKEKSLTQRQVAKSLGLDPSSLSLMLRGQRRMQLIEAESLAKLTGFPLPDILAHAGVDSTSGQAGCVPIVGWIDDENQIHFNRPNSGMQTIEAPPGVPRDTVALRFQTPGILNKQDGWLIYFSPKKQIDLDAIGRWSIIDLHGRSIVRTLQRGYSKGKYKLVNQNGESTEVDADNLRAATPILWVRCVA